MLSQDRKKRVNKRIRDLNKSKRPIITVHRTNKNIYVQLVGTDGNVIQSYSTANSKDKKGGTGVEKAKKVGQEFAKLCLDKGIKEVAFSKGSHNYSGRVKALAESCRDSGLLF